MHVWIDLFVELHGLDNGVALTLNWHDRVVSHALKDFHITVFQNSVLITNIVSSQSVHHCTICQSVPTKVCFCISGKENILLKLFFLGSLERQDSLKYHRQPNNNKIPVSTPVSANTDLNYIVSDFLTEKNTGYYKVNTCDTVTVVIQIPPAYLESSVF